MYVRIRQFQLWDGLWYLALGVNDNEVARGRSYQACLNKVHQLGYKLP